MSWLEAITISGLTILLISLGVIGFVCLLAWAIERDRGIEVFLFVVMLTLWATFAFILKTG